MDGRAIACEGSLCAPSTKQDVSAGVTAGVMVASWTCLGSPGAYQPSPTSAEREEATALCLAARCGAGRACRMAQAQCCDDIHVCWLWRLTLAVGGR